MSWWKRIQRSKAAVRFAADMIAFYVRLVYATTRWDIRGQEYPDAFWSENRPFVLSFWHGRLLMIPPTWRRDRAMHMLISQHRDGELIARAMDPFGIGTVRGSGAKAGKKDKGGSGALRVMVRQLKLNEYAGFTPDGPRGPRMRAGTGVIAAARLAKVPILPVTYAVKRRRVINSWDRFILPWPFNRGVYLWGEPIDVHSDTTETPEQAALRLEAVLNALTEQADRICGHSPIAPAERLVPQRDATAHAGGDA
ncbi:MAG: lysophospholipid acyltransferase family protein [Ferrovibrio sp.]|uniref:lysophospholipid acyltransferase family protein n=1 Tax=Ferrovibrio sp. TaxID=1917215 RepID=UPI00262AD12F|nr:lysophospholipid acyltransferase family protein [Ferrovibrio sp.]MCW0232847.1 lysophospholipid acyltransferase family protein [Ferrovibrio sp.]